jgi:hypothetical protein
VRLPPLLVEQPRSLQLLLAVVLPAAYGALTGYFLGVSEGTYLVLSVLGVLGGIGAGFDHHGARGGGKRKGSARVSVIMALAPSPSAESSPVRSSAPRS